MAQFISEDTQIPEGQAAGGQPAAHGSYHEQVSHAPMPASPLERPDQPAGEQEQGQYTELIGRVMSFVHDTTESEDGVSNADRVMDSLAVKTNEFWRPLGYTAGTIMQLFHNNAKRQGVEYDGHVIQEVGLDLVEELYSLAVEAGITEGGDKEEEYTEQEEDLLQQAMLEASRVFGEYMKSTGQLTADKQQAAKAEMEEQMMREAESGELEDWEGPDASPEMVQQMVGMGAKQNG